jgi:predicted GIY-YIG superfamily endonuclease
MKYLYIIQMKSTLYYKIGITNNLNKRLLALQTGNPIKLYIVRYYKIYTNANTLEKLIHTYLSEYHIHLEWFCISVDILKDIESVIKKHNIIDH